MVHELFHCGEQIKRSFFVLKFARKEKAISVFRNSPACPDLGTLLLLLGRLLSKEAVVHKMRGADQVSISHPVAVIPAGIGRAHRQPDGHTLKEASVNPSQGT